MPQDPGRLRCGTPSILAPPDILELAENGGEYYGAAFKGAQGVTQVDPLSPTIFNVVVDSVVRHWVSVMVESAEEQGGCRQEGRDQNSLFYAEYGMVASSYP